MAALLAVSRYTSGPQRRLKIAAQRKFKPKHGKKSIGTVEFIFKRINLQKSQPKQNAQADTFTIYLEGPEYGDR